DYTAELKAKMDYVESHDPFGDDGGGATEHEEKKPEPAKKPAGEQGPQHQGPIQHSVGKGGKNDRADVLAVQGQLKPRGGDPGTPDGDFGPHTLHAILAFQATFTDHPDGLIEPGKTTEKHLFFEHGPAIKKDKQQGGGDNKVVKNDGHEGHIQPGVK